MDKKQCNIIRDVLPLYIDDVVCEDTKEWVENHLAECPECASAAEKLRAMPVMPANTESRKHDMKLLDGFRRRFAKRSLITIAASAAAVLVLCAAAVLFLTNYTYIIEYDGSNIAIEETDNGYGLMLCYYGPGDFLYGSSTVPATGETTVVLSQSLWDLHISPMWDAPQTQYYLLETDRTLVVKEQETGGILWEADENQARRFHERRQAENDE